jgi:iron-sulfur cluster repair protein YtfE (RIC family)
MKHPIRVERYDGTDKELVRDITNRRYDSLEEFYKLLSKKYSSDARKDMESGHPLVSLRLKIIAEYHEKIREEFSSLWKICEKYMR